MASGSELPVAVIGAGPVGLAAAAHLLERGLTPLVLEAGDRVGASVAQWRHVRLFSPWCMNLDAAAVRLLATAGWTPPPADGLPTGAELLDRYLLPLASHPALAAHLHLHRRVRAISRQGMDKIRTEGRTSQPFVLRVADEGGSEQELQAKAVVDASGTWTNPNPVGASGIPALGEHQAAHLIVGGLPDVLGYDRPRYADRRVVVVGAGHSAATTLLALAALQRREPATEVVWAVRAARPRPLVGKGDADELPARGQLGLDLAQHVAAGRIELVTGFHTHAIDHTDSTVTLVDLDSTRTVAADVVVNATGYRPDHGIARELRLHLEPALESAAALGPLIDPNVHTCGSVPPHGARELAHPDAGYWIVGVKSYGRAPTFLLATGYEQVRSVVAAVAGDHRAANEVRLALPTDNGCPAHLPGSAPTTCCGGASLAAHNERRSKASSMTR